MKHLASADLLNALRRHVEATEAQERAEGLEAAVETLARDPESRKRNRVIGISAAWRAILRHVGRVASSNRCS